MERLIEGVGFCSGVLVPALALWAIVRLHTHRSGDKCSLTECAYFLALMIVSGVTVRTVMLDGGYWLVHTSSLCIMIVAGVMRRPVVEYEPIAAGDIEESLA